jgi:hypothetical protein
MSITTLALWQTTEKSRSELLYNCSEFDRQNDEWVPFSIGMGWSIINYGEDLRQTQIGTHEHLVLCAINQNTDQRRRGFTPLCRQSILNTLANHGISNIYMPHNAYFNTLPSYKFVISPEGNGIDCHRHYEALMSGCIPIIEEHEGIKEKYRGCPILYTKDYSEITPAYLEKVYIDMKDTVYDFSRLLMSSYSAKDQMQIRANGNYWSHQLSSKYWYH